MQILVQPMYSKQEINGDSNYVVYTNLLRGMLDIRPQWHFVVIFPDAKSGYRYEDDGFFSLPNVTRVPQRISPRKFSNAVSYDGAWYDQLFRWLGFDTIWCNLVEIGGPLKRAGAGSEEPKALPHLVTAHNYVIHETLPYSFKRMEPVALAQVVGALSADVNVFNSNYCQWMLMDTAARFLNEESLARIAANSTRIDYGPLDPDLPAPDYAGHDPDVPIIAYNHRLQSYKNYRATFDLFQELWDEGRRFKVYYLSNTSEMLTRVHHYPFMEVKLNATHEGYLHDLGECDLNVINSKHETFCIAAVESMALGQPLLAPQAITFPEITGQKQTRYPYLFKSGDEQKAMLIRLLEDVEERRRWGRELSAYVRGNYNRHLWAERYAQLFESGADVQLGSPPDARAFVRSIMEKRNGAETREVAAAIYGKVVNGRAPFSDQSLTLTKLVRLVRELGGEIRWEGGKQRIYAL